jgi:hypothetical protein
MRMTRMTRLARLGRLRVGIGTGAAVLLVALSQLSAPAVLAAPSPIQPGNQPTPIPGATNGALATSELIGVAPNCLAARAAAPSLGLLLRTARDEGVTLGTDQCYRALRDQLSQQQTWAAAGSSACAAPVLTGPTGQLQGTSMHGWGKAADFNDAGGTVAVGSRVYDWLAGHAGRFGWNHPGWAQPGGSPCPEAWHWEWVGDGGTLGASPIRADVVGLLADATGRGYTAVTGLGAITARGDAADLGSVATLPLAALVVGIAGTRDANGYRLVAADGGVFAFGDAGFFGSMGGQALNQPIVGIAATPDGRGYWEVAADGGIFAFGDAGFYGSMGATPLNRPVVGIAGTPDGRGYWEVAADGGIFAFGDAGFFGSMGGQALNQPVVGIAATPDGRGYWEVAADGGIFTFGDAGFFGSMGGSGLVEPVVGIAATPDGKGYWEVAADGGVFTFGDAGFYGAT